MQPDTKKNCHPARVTTTILPRQSWHQELGCVRARSAGRCEPAVPRDLLGHALLLAQ